MTVCNMSIEAGARAGLVAPDDTTFDYLEGRDPCPQGCGVGGRPRRLAHAAHRRRRGVGQGGHDRCLDPHAAGHVGHQPRPGRHRSTPASRHPTRTPTPQPASRSNGRSSTWTSAPARRSARSPSTPCSSDRARTAGSRTCGPRPRCFEGRHRHGETGDGRAGQPCGEGAGRGRRPRSRSSPPPAPTGANPAARCAWR